jgi:hypothetical protein
MSRRVLAPRLHEVRRRTFEIEDSRHADSPPEIVLERILTPATWPDWQSEILAVQGPDRLSEGDAVLGDAQLLGFKVEGRSTSLEITPDSYAQDVIVGVRMRVRYTVSPDGSGTRVTHRLESDLPRGVAGGVLSMLLRWRLRRMQRTLLDDLVAGSVKGPTLPAG